MTPSGPSARSGAQPDRGVARGGSAEAKRYLDPAVVARLSHLDVRARLVVEGFISGMHRSPFHGFSVEFAEHRPYMPGDPLKNLDWKVLAKSDRYLVKQYTEETNLRCHLLLDLSGSMGFQSPRASLCKLEYGRSLAAALAYLMLRQQDAVGAMMFADAPLRYVPARSVLVLEALKMECRPAVVEELKAVLPTLDDATRKALAKLRGPNARVVGKTLRGSR